MEYRKITVSSIELEYRKWKVLDKIKLDAIETDQELSVKEKELKRRLVLVYDCLKNPAVLDIEQYNYMLSLIRDYSLHNKIEFSFHCDDCGQDFDVNLSSPEFITCKNENYHDVTVSGKILSFGNVTDVNYDRDVLFAETRSERYLIDMAYHLHSIDGTPVNFADAFEFISNLDVDDFQVLFDSYDEMKFKCILEKELKCPHCGVSNLYLFDSVKDFFPESWSI